MITGLVAEDVPHDGACLFHALGAQLGVPGAALRAALVQIMQTRPELVVSGESLQNWIRWSQGETILASRHVWGGALEMALVSRLFRREVRVYALTRGGTACKLLSSVLDSKHDRDKQPQPQRRPLRVLWTGTHYMILRVPGH